MCTIYHKKSLPEASNDKAVGFYSQDKEKFVQTVSPHIPKSLIGRLANPLEPLLETKMVGSYTTLHKSDKSNDYIGGNLPADLEQMLVSM